MSARGRGTITLPAEVRRELGLDRAHVQLAVERERARRPGVVLDRALPFLDALDGLYEALSAS